MMGEVIPFRRPQPPPNIWDAWFDCFYWWWA